ncbi:MAG TPA: glycosyltransferase family 39 protein [Usitatibacter sp.]|nr:glycosyltransferase family 39 protein [Usitatibacter sp.]
MTDDALRGRIAYDGTPTPLKTALFLLVCAAWLLPGLVGHDPWKVDEAVVFGMVTEMLRSGDWVDLRVAGEPYLQPAPLFVWTAALFAKALGGLLPLHDAARLAAGLHMAVTLAALALASEELMAERAVRLSVLLFIGCLGLLIRAHEMTPDLAGLSGVAIGLYGLALAMRRPVAGGVATGLGMGLAFLGDGPLPLAMLAATLAVLPVAGAAWRRRSHAVTAAVALLCAAPLVAVWPLLLAQGAPATFHLWGDALARWGQPFTRDDALQAGYFFRLLPWYAWPAWPLAAWSVYRARRTLAVRPALQLPLVAFLVFLVVLVFLGEAREINAMPLLLPLAILGVAEIDSLPRGAASALDWFGMTTFFLLAAVLWVGWVGAIAGRPDFAVAWLQREVPGFTYRFDFIAFALAALLTLIWLVVVARSLRSTRRALVNWSAGITMVWMLVMTLGVPLVDQARSYRGISSTIVGALPTDFRCVARRNVGDAQRALLDYFVNLATVRDDVPAASRCNALLVQATPGRVPQVGGEWEEAWRGSRPGDRHELFVLYRRIAAAAAPAAATGG